MAKSTGVEKNLIGVPRVKNNWNSQDFPQDHEVNVLPSETVPDQSMSVRTLLQRYAQGIPLTDSGRVPIWYTDDELKNNREIFNVPDIEKLDISERYELIELQKERIKEMRQEMEKRSLWEKEQVIKEAQKRIQAAKDKENQTAPPSGAEPRNSNPNATKQ